MVYTLQRQDQQYGPYSIEQVRAMAQTGQALATDLLWTQGSSVPVTVASLLQATTGDATGGLIPYKNGAALTAYYLAVASLIPVIGVLTGIPALILGIKGLKRAKAEPWVKGKAHAWVGIVLGGGMALLWLALISVMIISIVSA